MAKLFFSVPARKFYVLALWGVLGAAVKAGYLPPETKAWLNDHALELVFLAFGLGHVTPEAAAAEPKGTSK